MKEETKKRLRQIVLIIIVGGLFIAGLVEAYLSLTLEQFLEQFLFGFLRILAIPVGIIFLFFVLWLLTNIGTFKAERKHPNFFEEMQTILRATLLPLGFEEREGPRGLARHVDYLRDEYRVKLWLDVRDSLYFLEPSSTTNRHERLYDFRIQYPITKADRFRSEVIEKLNEWLIEHDIK